MDAGGGVQRFNLVRWTDEKNNGIFSNSMVSTFDGAIHALGLQELDLMDRRFTESNGQQDPTLPRLDKVFMNNNFFRERA